ncbi:unnamed protein product [Lathyrus sativus]|nr:unnamed protein product [Lathyrus sativus]
MWHIQTLRSIISSGIFGKLIGNIIYAWSVYLKGAVYVTSFMPIQIAISVILGVIFLGDTLHIGSIIGATIISIGLYAVLWGKATEEIEEDVGFLGSPSTENAPLLQSYTTQTFEKYIYLSSRSQLSFCLTLDLQFSSTIRCLSIDLVLGHVPCTLHIFNVLI